MPTSTRLLLQWALSAGALLLVTQLYSGVQVPSFGSALWVALVLGLLNAVLRPVLVVLTLPVTVLTLGLFLLVVNGLVFLAGLGAAQWLAGARLLGGGLGALLYSGLGLLIDSLLARLFPR